MWGTVVKINVGLDCVLPIGVDNVIVSGRHLGTDHELSAHIRMIRDMEKLGESIGQIVSVALKDNVPLYKVDYLEVIKRLKATGCYNLDDSERLSPTPGNKNRDNIFYPTNEENCYALMKTNYAGFAILWAIRNMSLDKLKEWYLNSKTETFKFNIAITLALLDDGTATPTLLHYAKMHPSLRKKVLDTFNSTVLKPGFSALSTLKSTETRRFDMAPRFKAYIENNLLIENR